jgi:hypothetical protein
MLFCTRLSKFDIVTKALTVHSNHGTNRTSYLIVKLYQLEFSSFKIQTNLKHTFCIIVHNRTNLSVIIKICCILNTHYSRYWF